MPNNSPDENDYQMVLTPQLHAFPSQDDKDKKLFSAVEVRIQCENHASQ
jgi:hypothetical protein